MGEAVHPIADLPHAELGDQRGVSGQNSQVTVLPGNLHLGHSVLHHQPLRGHNFELDRIWQKINSQLSVPKTSSQLSVKTTCHVPIIPGWQASSQLRKLTGN